MQYFRVFPAKSSTPGKDTDLIEVPVSFIILNLPHHQSLKFMSTINFGIEDLTNDHASQSNVFSTSRAVYYT
jgi:hypothetical protein